MPDISAATLRIEPVEDHPGQRRIRVAYDLVTEASDPLAGRELNQRIELHGVDQHDAELPPASGPVGITEDTVSAEVGTHHHVVEWVVDRIDLDVEEDLWRATPGGREPIAEWLDHVTAEVTLTDGSVLVAKGTTPTVTGSWGPLGRD